MPQITGDVNNNHLFGTIEKEEILGLGGMDYLLGVGGTDTLDGGNGNDTLTGGTAGSVQAGIDAITPPETFESYIDSLKDTLTGGAGADRFVFSGMASNANVLHPTQHLSSVIQYNLDVITDFTSGIDKIVLHAYTSTIVLPSTTVVTDNFGRLPTGSITSGMLRILGAGEALPTNANDFLIYDTGSGVLYYDSEGTTKGPLAFAKLSGAPVLTAADFEIVAVNIVNGTPGNDPLEGTNTVDRISGQAGNDSLEGKAGDDLLQGGAGINEAIYRGNRADYLISRKTNFYVADTETANGNEGLDTLSGISRLKFQDFSVAYDLDGNAGAVAKIIGAVFGKTLVADPRIVGIGLYFMDKGTSYDTLMQLALGERLGGVATNRQVVDLLYTNLVGAAPSEASAKYYVDQLDAGIYTQTSLAVAASNLEENINNINLVGLSDTGLVYNGYLI